ncbi:nuclear body protein SP140-like protein [Sapajus apella]|uniref:Nuclear body protein SP140-like protein n=1 Tax=Sapajus apella TaxID=9515 RepID=A0A6J3HUI6_SAPAP|nr:nuclear body protein SP140-like protein [Sapajus apella]
MLSRMFAVVQKKKVSCEIYFNHFKENKVEIANAITKLFPFLESLRDNSFITEKMYANSQEACVNLIPVQKVVYQVLCHLEKVFDCSVLSVLFSKSNLKEYPDLIEIHKSFKKVLLFSQKRAGKETPKMPSFLPSCKQGAKLFRSKNRVEPSFVHLEDKQMARTACNQVPEIIVISSEDSDSCDDEELLEASSTASEPGPGEKGKDHSCGAPGLQAS